MNVSLQVESVGRGVINVGGAEGMTLIAVEVFSLDGSLKPIWAIHQERLRSPYTLEFATTTVDMRSVGTAIGPHQPKSAVPANGLMRGGTQITLNFGIIPEGMAQTFPEEDVPVALIPEQSYAIRLLLADNNEMINFVRTVTAERVSGHVAPSL